MSAFEIPACDAISSIEAAWKPREEKTSRAASRIAARRSTALRRRFAGFVPCVAAITERSVSWFVTSCPPLASKAAIRRGAKGAAGMVEHEEITLHGHRVSYRRAGWGPVIVLIHGITGSSDTWQDVIEPLAEKYTVVAPNLLGHGASAKPRGDYSLGAYASGIR